MFKVPHRCRHDTPLAPLCQCRGHAQPSPWARSCRARPVVSRCPIGPCDVDGLTASRLLESSADLHDVRDCLGHANITTTSRYVRSTPVRLAQALERMEAAAETVVDADDQPHLAEVR